MLKAFFRQTLFLLGLIPIPIKNSIVGGQRKLPTMLFLIGIGITHPLFSAQRLEELFQALEIAAYCDEALYRRFPVTYNYLLSTGYFITHSARMAPEGEIGVGGAQAPPYFHWSGRIQPFSRLELSLNYRIFRGCQDPSIGAMGFGDYADRGANFKYAFLVPEESFYHLPGLAFGVDDFMGSKKFTTYYLVATQVWPDLGLEVSCGWGAGRYTKGPSRGFFGGGNWFVFQQIPWLSGLSLTAEYDPTRYDRDPHPKGRSSTSPLNVGLHYHYRDLCSFSCSSLRGKAFAYSGSLHYNWGTTEGWLPKVDDPLPLYASTSPLGCDDPYEVWIKQLQSLLKDQRFCLKSAWIEDKGKKILTLTIRNVCYRQERVMRLRLHYLLAYALPPSISKVHVVLESGGLLCQRYTYDHEWLIWYANHQIHPYEFDLLTPREEVFSEYVGLLNPPPPTPPLFQSPLVFYCPQIGPRFESFLGSARGKFKYDLGVQVEWEGFLFQDLYYGFQASYTLLSTLKDVGDFDCLNPSQLPNVATDYVRYRKVRAPNWDRLFIQKSWNMGRGWFGRVAAGYFQINYGGIAGEFLWYPATKCWAVSLEGALVRKRCYTGWGFQTTLRQLEGKKPTYQPYSILPQYFASLYFDFPASHIFTKISMGQFLAGDIGARLELTRYFDNGLRLTGWITFTNAYDRMHGEKYYDRGVSIELPFDFFYRRSSRRVWNYGMAAWLRDAGYATTTGRSLFDILNRERRW